jgi:hypothetical protein
MLGPALTSLLRTLANIPERTLHQQAMFQELNGLFAATYLGDPAAPDAFQAIAHSATPEFMTVFESAPAKSLRTALFAATAAGSWKGFESFTYPYDPATGDSLRSTHPFDPATGGAASTGPFDPGASAQKCKTCEQYFPVSTQPP